MIAGSLLLLTIDICLLSKLVHPIMINECILARNGKSLQDPIMIITGSLLLFAFNICLPMYNHHDADIASYSRTWKHLYDRTKGSKTGSFSMKEVLLIIFQLMQ